MPTRWQTIADPKTEEIASKSDPDNTLLWKMPHRRLEAEPFRDALLFVAGRLDLSLGGTLLMTKNHDYVTNDQSGNARQLQCAATKPLPADHSQRAFRHVPGVRLRRPFDGQCEAIHHDRRAAGAVRDEQPRL